MKADYGHLHGGDVCVQYDPVVQDLPLLPGVVPEPQVEEVDRLAGVEDDGRGERLRELLLLRLRPDAGETNESGKIENDEMM